MCARGGRTGAARLRDRDGKLEAVEEPSERREEPPERYFGAADGLDLARVDVGEGEVGVLRGEVLGGVRDIKKKYAT